MNSAEVKNGVELLIDTNDKVKKILGSMDSSNSEHRRIVLEAVSKMILEYIVPLVEDYERSDKSVDYLKFHEVTDGKIDGLVSGIFDERLKKHIHGLKKPNDEAVKDALEYVDAQFADGRKRDLIFRCWAGIKANSSIQTLIDFLKEPLIGVNLIKLETIQNEQIKIEDLLSYKLPGGLRYSLESLSERLKRGK